MSTATDKRRSSLEAKMPPGTSPIPWPWSALAVASLQINIPAFALNLTAPLLEVTDFDSSQVIIRVAVDKEVTTLITLKGRLIENGRKFQPEEFGWQIELEQETPRAEFVASTIQVALSLAGNVQFRIPEYALDCQLNFEMPLSSISKKLQDRQTAYRLMVIERATNRRFLLPQSYSGDTVAAISFAYHAIVDRSFAWPFGTVQIPMPAAPENLDLLSLDQQPTRYPLPPTPTSRILLGQVIPLGHEIITIEDGIVERKDEVREEMSRNDGHLVTVEVSSLSGQVRYELPEAPRLPAAPWEAKIQTLVDLEERLALKLAARYHALAASTLAHLTEEAKAEITARPELDENAYLMND